MKRERSRVDDMRYLEDIEKDPLTIADLSKVTLCPTCPCAYSSVIYLAFTKFECYSN